MCPKCGICIRSLRRRAPPVAALCGHVFHGPCLAQWCETTGPENAPCPQCRLPVRQEDLRRLFLDDHRPHHKDKHDRSQGSAEDSSENTTLATPEYAFPDETSDTRSPSPTANETWVFPPESATFLDHVLMLVSDVNSLGREAAQKIRLSVQQLEEELLRGVGEVAMRLSSCRQGPSRDLLTP